MSKAHASQVPARLGQKQILPGNNGPGGKQNCCPHESCIVAALMGARQGLYYGGRIRIAHAIVMQTLFGTGSWVEKMRRAVTLSWQHGRNLGSFVFIYKLVLCLLTNAAGKRHNFFAFIAGIVGASVIWRERNVINQQLCFYLVSRVLEGCITVLRQKNLIPDKGNFSMVSVLIWGLVMYLFERDKSTLQRSLTSSMTFLYHDSDRRPTDLMSFVPLSLPEYQDARLSDAPFDRMVTGLRRSTSFQSFYQHAVPKE